MRLRSLKRIIYWNTLSRSTFSRNSCRIRNSSLRYRRHSRMLHCCSQISLGLRAIQVISSHPKLWKCWGIFLHRSISCAWNIKCTRCTLLEVRLRGKEREMVVIAFVWFWDWFVDLWFCVDCYVVLGMVDKYNRSYAEECANVVKMGFSMI